MKQNNLIKMDRVEHTFDDIVNKASPEIVDVLRQRDVIILPSHGYEDLYYQGSLNTLDYFEDNKVNIDIFATDDEYKELALHSAEIWLGTFLVKNVVIPIFLSLLSSYIYDKLKAKPDDSIALKLILEEKDGYIQSIEYKGKVNNLPEVFKNIEGINDDV